MAKQKDNTIVWVAAGLVALYFFLKRKQQPVEKSVRSGGGATTTLTAFPDEESYFKALYKEDQKNC